MSLFNGYKITNRYNSMDDDNQDEYNSDTQNSYEENDSYEGVDPEMEESYPEEKQSYSDVDSVFDKCVDLISLPTKTLRNGLGVDESLSDIMVMCFGMFASIFLGSFFVVAFLQLGGGASPVFGSTFPNVMFLFQKIDSFFMGKAVVAMMGIALPFLVVSLFCTFYFGEDALDSAWGTLLDQNMSQKIVKYWLLMTTVAFPSVMAILIPITLSIMKMGVVATVAAWIFSFFVMSCTIAIGFKVLSFKSVSWSSSLEAGVHTAFPHIIISAVAFSVILPKALEAQQGIVVLCAITMSWCFITSMVFFYGAKVAVAAEKSHFNDPDFVYNDDRSRKEVGLVCLLELTKRFSLNSFNRDKIGLHPYELSKIAKVSPYQAISVIEQLSSVGLVSILNDGYGNLAMLNFNPQNLIMADFLKRIEYPDDLGRPDILDIHSNKQFWGDYYNAIDETFSKLSLQDLYERTAGDYDRPAFNEDLSARKKSA